MSILQTQKFKEALFSSPAKILAKREGSDTGFCDEVIALAIAEEQNTVDDPLAAGQKLAGDLNRA